ncbi:zinc-binding alcohol dehydrogenase family protein [Streptomyces sp. NPDC001663]|uniref:quinone oxidoreductase family protein n=1 Tax=Streptomyces sp. NPDC001663 TaxID=3364597 RepID=UPI0036CC47B5
MILRANGGPEKLQIESVADPRAGAGDVLVRLTHSSLNFHDVLVRRGDIRTVLPRIIGMDGCGTRLDTGERVVISPSLLWGASPKHPGKDWEILGDVRDGTYAELVAVPADNVFLAPRGFSSAETAALPVGGLTAFRALFTRGHLAAGEKVLVLGAGGGVATFLVSLAAAAGAEVFVTSSSVNKILWAKEIGASDGILYTDSDWVAQALDMTGGGADLVIDFVGRDMGASLRCAQPGGRVVCFGGGPGVEARFNLREFFFSQRSVIGTTLGSTEDFVGLLNFIEDHPRWRPVSDVEFPLAQVAEAHARLESGAQFGKIVLHHG